MNRQQIIQKLLLCPNQLIIDDNTVWQHQEHHTRIKSHIDGDLHDFFDLVMDELLFQQISDKYDVIFIGEIFHVINLQSLVYNLEYALDCLNDNGSIYIAINANSIETSKSSSPKIISRLEKLSGYQLVETYPYQDEQQIDWTMLKLTKIAGKQLDETNLDDALTIGQEIASLVNGGKNISKLKAGYLKTNSKVAESQFKAAYTTNQELLSIYLKSSIIDLIPSFKRQYLLDLADFVFNNRKSLQVTADLELLKQGSFTLALDTYQRHALMPDNQYIAKVADLIDQIWSCCLKNKLNSKLKEQIEQIEE